MKKIFLSLLIAVSFVFPLKSNAIVAGAITWPAVAAATMLFGGAASVDALVMPSNQKGIISMLGIIAALVILEDGRQSFSLNPVSAELAASKNLSSLEAAAYNAELPVITALMQSAGDSVEQAKTYLQANRGMISPTAQSAMAKIFAVK